MSRKQPLRNGKCERGGLEPPQREAHKTSAQARGKPFPEGEISWAKPRPYFPWVNPMSLRQTVHVADFLFLDQAHRCFEHEFGVACVGDLSVASQGGVSETCLPVRVPKVLSMDMKSFPSIRSSASRIVLQIVGDNISLQYRAYLREYLEKQFRCIRETEEAKALNGLERAASTLRCRRYLKPLRGFFQLRMNGDAVPRVHPPLFGFGRRVCSGTSGGSRGSRWRLRLSLRRCFPLYHRSDSHRGRRAHGRADW